MLVLVLVNVNETHPTDLGLKPQAEFRRCFAASAMLVALLVSCSDSNTSPTHLPPEYLRDCSFLVFFDTQQAPDQIAVIGDFNSWDEQANPMVDGDGDGRYWARINAFPGTQQYRVWIDGETHLDPYNPLTLFDAEGRENSAARVPDCSVPALKVLRAEASAGGTVEIDLRFLRADPGAPAASMTASLGDGTALDAETSGHGDIAVRGSGLRAGKHRVTVTADDSRGVSAATLSLPLWVEQAPFDWRDAVIYQVMVDRFRKGDGALDDQAGISVFHGGDLDGVTRTIEDGNFENLGVNTLWLSPVYKNPQGVFIGRDGHEAEAYHGYWPSDPRAVDDRFGGETALRNLVEAAHDRGIRVILDSVLNHVHTDHPYWRDHQGPDWFNNPDADCICGFSCPWSTSIQTCWFDPFLADLRWHNWRVVDQLVDDAAWWIDRFDLDGLRLDAIPMMPRLATRHLRDRLNRTLDAGGNHTYLLGETYTSRGGQPIIRYHLGPQGLSGQFDFPVMWLLRDALAGRVPMTELDAEVLTSEAAWAGSGAVMGLILGNHDVSRFVSDVNDDPVYQPRDNPPASPDTDRPYDLQRMAFTFLFSMPGAPVIYYGDEIGMPGATDPDNRRNMRFGQDVTDREQPVRRQVELLGRARACSTALRRGSRQTLLVHDNLYAFARGSDDGYPAIAVLNRATIEREVVLELPPAWTLSTDARFGDVLGAGVTADGREVRVTVPPRSSALILSDPSCLNPG